MKVEEFLSKLRSTCSTLPNISYMERVHVESLITTLQLNLNSPPDERGDPKVVKAAWVSLVKFDREYSIFNQFKGDAVLKQELRKFLKGL